jgi:hypothetical protein
MGKSYFDSTDYFLSAGRGSFTLIDEDYTSSLGSVNTELLMASSTAVEFFSSGIIWIFPALC